MRFLADMGVARGVVAWLRDGGHDVVHLLDEGLERLPDQAVLAKAEAEDRILLTFDLDFGEILALSGQRSGSVVLFRLSSARPEQVIDRLRHVIAEVDAALSEGAIVTAEETRLRVRRLPVARLKSDG